MLIILVSFNSFNSDNAQKEGIWQQPAMHPTWSLLSMASIIIVFHGGETNLYLKSLRKSRERETSRVCQWKADRHVCTLKRYWKNIALGVQRRRCGLSGNKLILGGMNLSSHPPSPSPGQKSEARQIPSLFLEWAVEHLAGALLGNQS